MPASAEELLQAAAKTASHAYARYSDYHVGAALLTTDGHVMTGCNVENGSYGLTVCAERIALFTAVAAGIQTFEAIAITSDTPPLPSPCGACRQVLAEFCGPELKIYTANEEDLTTYNTFTLGELLPHSFRF